MFFPILWYFQYLPGGFRFFVALVIFVKMMKDVHNYNWKFPDKKPVGVLKKESAFVDKRHWNHSYQHDAVHNRGDMGDENCVFGNSCLGSVKSCDFR